MDKFIYLDNAATTKTSETVVEAMLPYFTEYYGNASGIYSIGVKSREAINNSRRIIADTIGARPEEIYFTAGGTESDNWALRAAAEMSGSFSAGNAPGRAENSAAAARADDQAGSSAGTSKADDRAGGSAGTSKADDRAGSSAITAKSACHTGNPAISSRAEPQIKNHIITTRIEHHAILHTCEYLEKSGVKVTYLNVDENGIVNLEELRRAIRPETFLISVMFANNEIGSIQPIREIGEIAKEHGILFHTDAVQAYGQIPIDVEELHIDLMSASAHKLNGPKGVGFLYIRRNIRLRSLIHGGAQERHRRAGTENVPGIVGFGQAAKEAFETMRQRAAYESGLRDILIDRILREVPYARLNGHRTKRLPNNANFSFQFIEGETLLIMLDMEGICGSSGSACTTGSLDPSHVLLAIGLPDDLAHGSLRLTLSAETTREEIDVTVETVKKIVERLRSMSPQYEDFCRRQEHAATV
ncbi:MAG: aminotransferase class V-fold PLP-dependent enzyme [Lachnospiraceae bacterium]|nr:aminotransferase class V-fold PLP-dependent enzyme [Lachnospiraceae bacterium]